MEINALLQLSDQWLLDYGIDFLCTRRLNQNPLKNVFAIIRQQHGCSVNPSPRQFENGIRHLLITQLGKISTRSNCETDANKRLKNTFPMTRTAFVQALILVIISLLNLHLFPKLQISRNLKLFTTFLDTCV